MEDFNKDGKVYKCYDLDSIQRMNISDRLKEEYSDKFNKLCYFRHGQSTKLGVLIGIETNEQLSDLYYILRDKDSNNKYYISCTYSLGKVNLYSQRKQI